MTINNTQGTKCRIFTTLIILLIGIIVGNTFTSCSSDSDDDGDKGGSGTVSSSSSDNGVVGGGSSSSGGGGTSSGGGGGSSGSGTPFESEYTQEAFPQLTNASEFIGDWKSGSYTVTLESNGSWAMKLAGVTVGSYSGLFLVSGNTAYFYVSEPGGYYLNGYGTKSGNTMSMDGGFGSLAASWTKQGTTQPPTTPGRGENIAEIYRAGDFLGDIYCYGETGVGSLVVDFFVNEEKIEWEWKGGGVGGDDCALNLPETGRFEDVSTSGGDALIVFGIQWGMWSYVYSGDNMIGIVYIKAANDDDDDSTVHFVIGKKQTSAMPELSVVGFNGNVSEISEDVQEMWFNND